MASRPRLRLVDPDERAPAPPTAPPTSRSPGPHDGEGPIDDLPPVGRARDLVSAGLAIAGLAVLVIGAVFAVRTLLPASDTGPRGEAASSSSSTADGDSVTTPTLPPPLALPDATAPPPTGAPSPGATSSVPPPGAAVPGPGAPGLVPLPVVPGATGGPAPTSPAPTTTSGSARLRIFNAYASALDVWDVAGADPVRYGTVGYSQFVEMTAGGSLLPSGVDLQLRLVPFGGDPFAADAKAWDFTPPPDSSQTLVLTDNGGLRVLRIDNRRASAATPAGRAHIVPAVFHLVIGGRRANQWAVDGRGCLGHSTTEDVEFDLDPGAVLRIAAAGDPGCTSPVSGGLSIDSPGAYAAVGIEQPGGVQIVAVPLG